MFWPSRACLADWAEAVSGYWIRAWNESERDALEEQAANDKHSLFFVKVTILRTLPKRWNIWNDKNYHKRCSKATNLSIVC